MTDINLHVEPGTVQQWPEFTAEKGPFSVALDGYVKGEPRFNPDGPQVNFNHHEDVDRLATAATCEQVLTAIRSGFFQTFRDKGMPKAEIFVNDCDQDVCTSVYLLRNAPLAQSATNPLLNALVSVEGKLDATAGGYPFNPDLEIMRKIAWIFEPYTSYKNSKEFDEKSPQRNEEVIDACSGRIHDYLLGKAKEIPLDLRFEVLDKRPGYTVVDEVGEHSRISMFASGIDSFVSVHQTEQNGVWRYVIGRRSYYVPFPVKKIFETLNAADPLVAPGNDWSGGNIIGGSPRDTNSGLTPDQVVEIVDSVLKAKEIKPEQ